MRSILSLIVILPWWAFFGLAGGMLYLTNLVYQSELTQYEARLEAAKSPPPEPVDLVAFTKSGDVTAADEVHVTGWINTDYNYHLIKRTNGIQTGERFMMLLFGQGDVRESKTVRAALVMTEDQKNEFTDNMYKWVSDYGEHGLIFTINGFVGRGNGFSSLAYDAMSDEGLTRSPHFIYIEPFLEGRQAAMAQKGNPEGMWQLGGSISAVLALIGVIKLVLRRKSKGSRDDFAASPISDGRGRNVVVPTAASGSQYHQTAVMALNIDPDSPLARLQRKQEGQTAPTEEPKPQPVQSGSERKNERKKKQRFRIVFDPVFILSVILMVVAVVGIGAVVILPWVVLVGFWYFVFKAGKKLEKGIDAIKGIEREKETLFTFAGLNVTRTREAKNRWGGFLGTLYERHLERRNERNEERHRRHIALKDTPADPFEKLAAEVRRSKTER